MSNQLCTRIANNKQTAKAYLSAVTFPRTKSIGIFCEMEKNFRKFEYSKVGVINTDVG